AKLKAFGASVAMTGAKLKPHLSRLIGMEAGRKSLKLADEDKACQLRQALPATGPTDWK
ncbi:unnamed protein product, partial [marine sediment metagenome]